MSALMILIPRPNKVLSKLGKEKMSVLGIWMKGTNKFPTLAKKGKDSCSENEMSKSKNNQHNITFSIPIWRKV